MNQVKHIFVQMGETNTYMIMLVSGRVTFSKGPEYCQNEISTTKLTNSPPQAFPISGLEAATVSRCRVQGPALGILAHLLRMVMEPKYYEGDWTPLAHQLRI